MRACALGALLLTACSGPFQKVVRRPAAPLALTTVFVYPVQVKGAAQPAWRTFEVTQRLVDVGVREAGDALAFYGPSEFKVMRWDDEGAWVATTALPLLARAGSREDQGVVLRVSAERRVSSSVQEAVDAKGKPKGATSAEETVWLAKVDVVHPATREVLVEVSGQVATSPFDEPLGDEEFDPAPRFTRLLEQLTAAAVREARRHAAKRPAGPEHGLTLAVTPKTSVGWHDEGTPSAEVEVFRMDPLEAEVFLQNRARFLSPWLADPLPMKLSKLPAGTCVVAAPGDAKLKPGDVVTEVDGQPGLPQVLARARFLGRPVQLKVRRAEGALEELVFP